MGTVNIFVKMLRCFAAILLLLAFAAQTFQRSFLVLDYYANAGSFAKDCENKFRPQMHCNGKCVLMKKLKEQETKDQQNPERKQENKNEVVFAGTFYASLDIALSSYISPLYADFLQTGTLKMPRSFFHPPDA